MIHVAVHPSQFPDRVEQDMIESLRTGRVKHKFLYDSYTQAQKWLALHEAHSPVANDPSCLAAYEQAFSSVGERFANSALHVVGLGCGGGHKDAALLEQLKCRGKSLFYTAVDVSLPLVITACQRAEPLVSASRGLICDLEQADELQDELREHSASRRIVTFFGMIPNSEPDIILPRLRKLLSPGDVLLTNANLAPGKEYREGVKRVLPQYNNALTADWLLTFLVNLGIDAGDGELQFTIEETSSGLLRIRADFVFARYCAINVYGKDFSFSEGEAIRLFYSYRYTPEVLKHVLEQHNFHISEQWLAASGEEGIFLITP